MLRQFNDTASASERPAALVLAPETPYPVRGGGPMRTASLLEFLRVRYDVEVITFREPGSADPGPLFPPEFRVHVLNLPWHSKSTASRALRNFGRYVRDVPPLVDRFSGFEATIAGIIGGRRFALGVIEHFWCAPYAAVMRGNCERLVLNLHNVESVLMARCAAAENGLQSSFFERWALSCERLERKWLPDFDVVLTTSEADAASISVPSVVYPNAIPLVLLPNEPKRCEIVFSGNLEYQPNQTAVRWFIREIWPGVKEQMPTLTWKLVGKNDHAIRHLISGDPRVVATGPVDDSVRSLARSTLAIAPVLSGSGTRVKIIEAWAAGLPVVSTSTGAEGLPGVAGEHLLIADTPADFGHSIVNILTNTGLRNQLAANGRRLYEEHLTWESAWKVLNRRGL